MAAVTGSELFSAVAARLKMAESEMADYWQTICDEAATAALVDVQAVFQKRGYTAAQVNSADSLNHWTKTLGLYWALLHGGAYSGFEAETLKGLDIRKGLENTPLVVNGAFLPPTPANSQIGGAPQRNVGRQSSFNWPGTEAGLTDDMPIEW